MKLPRYQMREEVGVEGVPALFVAAAVEGNAHDLARLRLLHTAARHVAAYLRTYAHICASRGSTSL